MFLRQQIDRVKSADKIAVRVLVAVCLVVLTLGVLYGIFGHELIESAYKTRNVPILSKMFEDEKWSSAEYYRAKADRLVVMIEGLLLIAGVTSALILSKRKELANFLQQDSAKKISAPHEIARLLTPKSGMAGVIVPAGLLFVICFSAYSVFGARLARSGAFRYDDLLVEIDTPSVIADMTDLSAAHSRTKVHPIFVLLVAPLGSVLQTVLHSKVNAAIFLNAGFGAGAVALMYLVSYVLTRRGSSAFLVSALFAVSMSQVFLSSVPHYGELAACSLLFTMLVFLISLETGRIYPLLWIVAGVFSLGVTTTNVVATIICLFLVLRRNNPPRRKSFGTPVVIAFYIISVIFVVFTLSLCQKIFFPQSGLFFLPETFQGELRYTSNLLFVRPVHVLLELGRCFLLTDVIAPFPIVYEVPNRVGQFVTFHGSWDYSVVGVIGFVLWATMVLFSFRTLRSSSGTGKTVTAALAACFLFNVVLHCFYGTGEKGRMELFLYTSNVTYLVVLSFAGGLLSSPSRMRQLVAGVATIIIAANNLLVMNQLIGVYNK